MASSSSEYKCCRDYVSDEIVFHFSVECLEVYVKSEHQRTHDGVTVVGYFGVPSLWIVADSKEVVGREIHAHLLKQCLLGDVLRQGVTQRDVLAAQIPTIEQPIVAHGVVVCTARVGQSRIFGRGVLLWRVVFAPITAVD